MSENWNFLMSLIELLVTNMIKITKLALLVSLSTSFAYSITESFNYSRFDIPKDTFDIKTQILVRVLHGQLKALYIATNVRLYHR